MQFTSKKISLVVLGITSLLFSRAVFMFINDPEGPNLLVVVVLAGVIYGGSVMVFLSRYFPSLTGVKRLAFAICIQVILATVLCLFLK